MQKFPKKKVERCKKKDACIFPPVLAASSRSSTVDVHREIEQENLSENWNLSETSFCHCKTDGDSNFGPMIRFGFEICIPDCLLEKRDERRPYFQNSSCGAKLGFPPRLVKFSEFFWRLTLSERTCDSLLGRVLTPSPCSSRPISLSNESHMQIVFTLYCSRELVCRQPDVTQANSTQPKLRQARMTNMYNASQKQLRRKKRENFHAR
jgi:hypothetical protein